MNSISPVTKPRQAKSRIPLGMPRDPAVWRAAQDLCLRLGQRGTIVAPIDVVGVTDRVIKVYFDAGCCLAPARRLAATTAEFLSAIKDIDNGPWGIAATQAIVSSLLNAAEGRR